MTKTKKLPKIGEIISLELQDGTIAKGEVLSYTLDPVPGEPMLSPLREKRYWVRWEDHYPTSKQNTGVYVNTQTEKYIFGEEVTGMTKDEKYAKHIVTPIKPQHNYTGILTNKELELFEAIQYINFRIIKKEWHIQINKVDGYHAIVLAPYGSFLSVMDTVVEQFKKAGWDCYWKETSDSRGPHNCFYVNQRHFIIDDVSGEGPDPSRL
jgi:hypothetical protein